MEDGGNKEDRSSGGLEGGTSGSGHSTSWTPRIGAFRPYDRTCISLPSSFRSSKLGVIMRRPLVARLTKDIAETFQICNPRFRFSEVLNPKRFLTNPSTGVLNDGYDNEANDLILHVNFILVNMGSKQRYVVKDLLGQGTFGQVAKCWVSETDSYVAVKIIKNQPAYYQQALVEVSILTMLGRKFNNDEHQHIVRMLDYFVYQHHLCISFELLGANLYELIKLNKFRGFPLNIVRQFSSQILHALVIVKDAGIIHCDLKPENILMTSSIGPDIKIIDFGSACLEGRTVYSYIQSRYYRSPEVLLGYPYTTAIDMWSFGCIVAELFLGLPLFAGASEYDLLQRMVEILGGQPPDDLLRDAQHTNKFFKYVGSIYRVHDEETSSAASSSYRVLTAEEYEVRECKKPVIGKRYFNYVKLEDIIAKYPHRNTLSEEEVTKEIVDRLKLVDFLRGLVEFDPAKRWSPLQASRHPFVTGEALTCPYRPLTEAQQIHVTQAVTVDRHNPGGGHWLAAGLSPQVQNVNRCFIQNSPQFWMMPLSHGGSYGSLGSHGSFIDNVGIGGSYGSYGEANTVQTYFSPVGPYGMKVQAQVGGPFLGASPDTWRRPPRSHGNLFSVSPTGNLGPMALGASPSQFTPPCSQVQISSFSPGKYVPSSSRGSLHGSPLGKAAAVAQYNRRRALGNPRTSNMQLQESAASHWQGYQNEDIGGSLPDACSHMQVPCSRTSHPTSNHSCWRSQMSGVRTSGPSTNSHLMHSNLNTFYTNAQSLLPSESDKHEGSSVLPDPADWDPNYSDELLLQEDNYEVASLSLGFANVMRLHNIMDSSTLTSGVTRLSHGASQAPISSNVTAMQRDRQFKAFSPADSCPNVTNDVHTGFNRPPHVLQNSSSRFSQQPYQSVNRYNNQLQSMSMHGLRTHEKIQPSHLNHQMVDSHPSSMNMLNSSMQWGQRAGHPIAAILPTSHARKDYGSIS
ncbi:hypothetical protein HPP92_013931 [Vanilla planifolia]|uniref:Protein kinase domain-containing protein n=1 Tax=Vanilla planifolia TaxID=51239 RepID=A0A835QJ34_VANPL|nr:hypothetical protein HPP92_013931 [Vanilla planifolia]